MASSDGDAVLGGVVQREAKRRSHPPRRTSTIQNVDVVVVAHMAAALGAPIVSSSSAAASLEPEGPHKEASGLFLAAAPQGG